MDWVLSDDLGVTVGHLVRWGSAAAMIIGGAVPYVPQYLHIRRTQDAEGFSLYVCLTLLIANILRILFWFGKQYEYPLLVQSVVMNVTMFFMIHLCVRVKSKNQLMHMKPRMFTDLDPKYFWAWTDFQSYIDFILALTITLSIIMYFLIEVVIFVEIVGFLSVFTEAMLGTPQLVRNYKTKSTEGMSLLMVLMWTCGDVFKTVYFIAREAPFQFWMCGTLQVSVDLAILLQVYVYKDAHRPLQHRID